VREKVSGGSKEDFHKLYCSVNITRMITLRWIRWADNVLFMGEMRNTYKILAGKPERKRLLRISMRRWENVTRSSRKN
jgi:hypothetical protein